MRQTSGKDAFDDGRRVRNLLPGRSPSIERANVHATNSPGPFAGVAALIVNKLRRAEHGLLMAATPRRMLP